MCLYYMPADLPLQFSAPLAKALQVSSGQTYEACPCAGGGRVPRIRLLDSRFLGNDYATFVTPTKLALVQTGAGVQHSFSGFPLSRREA